MSRSSSQTTSCVRPIANDGTSSTPSGVGDHPDRLGQDRGSPRPRARARGRRRSTRRGRSRRRSSAVGSRRIGVPGPAEVARADDDPLLAALVLLDAQPDDRRAEDVAGVDERRVDPGRDLDLLAVADGLELGERRARRPWPCRAARRGRCRGAAAGRAAPPRGRSARPARSGRRLGRRRRSSAAPASSLARLAGRRQLERRLVLVGLACGRRPRPCPGGASPSAPRAWRTPRGACPSRAGRASPARSCRPWRGSRRGSRP